MTRSQTENLLVGIFGAALAGVGLMAWRSCRGRGKRARQLQREATAIKNAINNGIRSHMLDEGVFNASGAGAVEAALALPAPLMRDAEAQAVAQRIAAFEDVAKRLRIPESFGNALLMDYSIIFSLAPKLNLLVRELDELDMVKEWPAEGDSLLWRGFSLNLACQRIAQRSPDLVAPAVAVQMATLHSCLSALLQQRQHAREVRHTAQSGISFVEIGEEETVVCLPLIATCGNALDRSVSDASSSGTPSAETPMSMLGSVVGDVASLLPLGKSPLGDATLQGSSHGGKDEAGIGSLNAKAVPFVPANPAFAGQAAPPPPPPPGKKYRPRRRRRAGASLVIPPPPPHGHAPVIMPPIPGQDLVYQLVGHDGFVSFWQY